MDAILPRRPQVSRRPALRYPGGLSIFGFCRE
jgi:hypothetical protein